MMIWLQDMVRMWWTAAAISMSLCHIIPMSTPRPFSRITIKKLVMNFHLYPGLVVSIIYILCSVSQTVNTNTRLRVILYYIFYYYLPTYLPILFRITNSNITLLTQNVLYKVQCKNTKNCINVQIHKTSWNNYTYNVLKNYT